MRPGQPDLVVTAGRQLLAQARAQGLVVELVEGVVVALFAAGARLWAHSLASSESFLVLVQELLSTLTRRALFRGLLGQRFQWAVEFGSAVRLG